MDILSGIRAAKAGPQGAVWRWLKDSALLNEVKRGSL